MWSTAPETATTVPNVRASSVAASSAASTSSVASTPRPPAPPVASAMTSDALPRTIVGDSATSSCASRVRTGRAPTATGSSTHGVPASRAACAASTAASRCSACGVPRLTSRPDAIRANGPASVGTSVIAGAAPSASRTFAVKPVTTAFVMHCTSGWRSRSRRRRSAEAVPVPVVSWADGRAALMMTSLRRCEPDQVRRVSSQPSWAPRVRDPP